MFGQAILSVPANKGHKAIREEGLSDEMAMSYGRLFAMTLSEPDGHVVVTLGSGSIRVIGHNTATGKLAIRRLHPNYQTFTQRSIGL